MAEQPLPVRGKFDLQKQYYFEGSSKVNQPFILNMATGEKLFFQTMPVTIDENSADGWQAVYSPGRNIPLYQYTGGEDTISMTITWYAADDSREDVINKIKWLKNLTKADGYSKAPPQLSLCFGKLYKAAKFILCEMNVQLTGFNREYGMLPTAASTELTFKRVEEKNPDWKYYMKLDT